MPKYFMTWEIDTSKVPISREERAAAWGPMVEMVKQGIKDGHILEWGTFVGEMKGYSVAQGSEIEMGVFNQQWVPFVNFEVHPVLTVDELQAVIAKLA